MLAEEFLQLVADHFSLHLQQDSLGECSLSLPQGDLACQRGGQHIFLLREGKKLFFDFTKRERQVSRQDMLYRALKLRVYHRVIDATCGAAFDAFHLLQLGVEVISYERDLAVFLLLLRAAQLLDDRIKVDTHFSLFAGRWQVWWKDSREEWKKGYAILLDPIFQQKKKRKAKKEIELLRNLVSDEDQAELLKSAIASGERVAFKRHRRSLPLIAPHDQIVGKSIAFDLYNL